MDIYVFKIGISNKNLIFIPKYEFLDNISLFYIPFNFKISVGIPINVIILEMLKQVERIDSSASVLCLPRSKNCPAPKLRFIWPKGNSAL